MKILFILIFFGLFNSKVIAQEIDSNIIESKAKLLTVSRYGWEKIDIILEDIQNQKLTYLNSPSSNLLLMKIEFDQNFYKGAAWLNSCSYYVGFNFSTNTFYRLGGFDSNDVEDFFNNLSSEDLAIYDVDFESEFDFPCLIEYHSWSNRRKKKRGFNCFPKCSEHITKWIIQGGK